MFFDTWSQHCNFLVWNFIPVHAVKVFSSVCICWSDDFRIINFVAECNFVALHAPYACILEDSNIQTLCALKGCHWISKTKCDKPDYHGWIQSAKEKEQVVNDERRMKIFQITRTEMDMKWKGVWQYLSFYSGWPFGTSWYAWEKTLNTCMPSSTKNTRKEIRRQTIKNDFEPGIPIWCDACQMRINSPSQWDDHVGGETIKGALRILHQKSCVKSSHHSNPHFKSAIVQLWFWNISSMT